MSDLSSMLLAQAANGPTPGPLRLPREVLLLLGAVLLLVLVFVVWAMFIRKRKKDLSDWRLQKHHHHSPPENSANEGSGEPHHRRRRRRRREHRPRNPTLAETGGLPPIRHEPPPESSS